jgi:hypothetical protein
MSARRVTEFTCDDCGAAAVSPDNYSLPEGWEHHNPAGEPSRHKCTNCIQRECAAAQAQH